MTGEFADHLRMLADRAGLPLPPEALERLAAFFALLMEANRTMNLTKVTDPAEAAERHFMDSLAGPALAALPESGRVIDVGTGAGFPGIPIAILKGGLEVVLLDSMKKRTSFLETAAKELGLINVSVVTARAEEYARGAGREAFDVALSRAVAGLNVLLEYTLPFVRVGGRALAWKGPAAPQEIAAAATACRALGGAEPKAHGYAVSGRGGFFIVEIKKIRRTPPNFPRKAGKPASDPIK